MVLNIPFLKKLRKPKVGSFIKPSMYDPKSIRVWDLADMVRITPFTMDQLAAKGVYENGVELCKVAASVAQNAAYMLYQIPAIRKYFGSDYLHGFRAKTSIRNDICQVDYDNLDDTIESIEFTKEITATIQRVLWDFLENQDLYIVYEGDYVYFLPGEIVKSSSDSRHMYCDKRILWREG